VADQSCFVDTEFFSHVLVVVSRGAEDAFLSQYELLASDAVGYGPAADRQAVLGSPVVPGSALKIAQDNDGYVLYAITLLRTFKDVYAQALTKARFTVRERFSAHSKTEIEQDEETSPEVSPPSLFNFVGPW
jgi:hypothetical protein